MCGERGQWTSPQSRARCRHSPLRRAHAAAVLPDSQLGACARTFPVVETIAALLKSAAMHSTTPVTLPVTDPSQTAIITPALRTARAATSVSVGVLRSITAASMATATGMADLQRNRFQQGGQNNEGQYDMQVGVANSNRYGGQSKQSWGFSCRALSSVRSHCHRTWPFCRASGDRWCQLLSSWQGCLVTAASAGSAAAGQSCTFQQDLTRASIA